MDSNPAAYVHGIFSGKNTGVGSHFLLQGIFLTQGLNLRLLCLLYWQAGSLPLAPPGVLSFLIRVFIFSGYVLDIYNTFYGRSGWEGVGQAKAVVFFLIVAVISLTQLVATRSKEVEN